MEITVMNIKKINWKHIIAICIGIALIISACKGDIMFFKAVGTLLTKHLG